MKQVSVRPSAKGPLDGVRVHRHVAARRRQHDDPVLADFGADVIKVERPGKGDDLRSWRVEGIETFWKIYARNKRSIALDIQDRRGARGASSG